MHEIQKKEPFFKLVTYHNYHGTLRYVCMHGGYECHNILDRCPVHVRGLLGDRRRAYARRCASGDVRAMRVHMDSETMG